MAPKKKPQKPRYMVTQEDDTGNTRRKEYRHSDYSAHHLAKEWGQQIGMTGRVHKRRHSIYLHVRSYDNDD